MSTDSTTNIVIKLHESGDAKAFGQNNIIHKEEFINVLNKIKSRIPNKDNEIENQRLHDTITILGSRGSGKTSFLQSVREICSTGNGFVDSSEYKDFLTLKNDIAVLDVIDPTLMEEKGHVFLNIISIIQEKVEEVLKKKDCDPCNNENKNARKEWRDKIAKLAAGIPSIDGIGGHYNDNHWQDPEYVMDKGLKGVAASRKLEKEFNTIIEQALNLLGKKLFLLSFDDIDIDFKKGWPVLETIRKYCTSPRLVILLSGDMHLYSMAIRKQQWRNFGRPLLKNESEQQDKLGYFNEMVTEMEGQYMQKVMKPTNRIHLKTLNEKLLKPGFAIKVWEGLSKERINGKEKEFEISVDIVEVYNKALEQFGIRNKYQAEAYRSFLLSMPIRSQIQFLLHFYANDGSWNASQKAVDNDNVVNAFLSELYDRQVDVQLATSVPKFLNIIALKLLIKEQVLSDAYQLQPTTTDKSLNSSLVALNFLISNRIQESPYLIFDYFIRIGLSRNFLSLLGYQSDLEIESNIKASKSSTQNDNLTASKPSIEGLCKHASLLQDKVLKDTVGLMIAYMQAYFFVFGRSSQLREERSKVGMIPILSLAGKRKKALNETNDRIDSVFKDKNPIQKALGYFPLSISSHPFVNRSSAVYSVFNIIGVIMELLRQLELGITNITLSIKQLSQIRLYNMPDFKRANNVSELFEIDGSNTENNSEINDEYQALVDLLKVWKQSYSAQSLSPHTLGKIFTRFYSALENIQVNDDNDNVAEILQLQIISFFNSVLIEEASENFDHQTISNSENTGQKDIKGININNIRKELSIFKNNLQAIDGYDKMDFTKWILSCPLLLVYLNPDAVYIDELIKFIDGNQIQDNDSNIDTKPFASKCLELSIFSILSNVRIRDKEIQIIEVNFQDEISVSDSNVTRLTNAEIFNFLSQSGAEFDLFSRSPNRAINFQKRSQILNQFSNIFGVGTEAFRRISDFRNYLQRNNLKW